MKESGVPARLLEEIERLRSRMHSMALNGAGRGELLETSRELDILIVEFYAAVPGGKLPLSGPLCERGWRGERSSVKVVEPIAEHI